MGSTIYVHGSVESKFGMDEIVSLWNWIEFKLSSSSKRRRENQSDFCAGKQL